MPSSRAKPSLRRQIYLSLVGKIEGQLRDVFTKYAETSGLTQTEVAQRLGVNKSLISRRLSGRTNMTIESIADMAWAIGACVEVEIFDPLDRPDRNSSIATQLRMNSPISVQPIGARATTISLERYELVATAA